MDKLRRSFRKSFHRGNKDRGLTNSEIRDQPSSSTSSPSQSGSKSYQQDETSVRTGSCSFNVKVRKKGVGWENATKTTTSIRGRLLILTSRKCLKKCNVFLTSMLVVFNIFFSTWAHAKSTSLAECTSAKVHCNICG